MESRFQNLIDQNPLRHHLSARYYGSWFRKQPNPEIFKEGEPLVIPQNSGLRPVAPPKEFMDGGFGFGSGSGSGLSKSKLSATIKLNVRVPGSIGGGGGGGLGGGAGSGGGGSGFGGGSGDTGAFGGGGGSGLSAGAASAMNPGRPSQGAIRHCILHPSCFRSVHW